MTTEDMINLQSVWTKPWRSSTTKLLCGLSCENQSPATRFQLVDDIFSPSPNLNRSNNTIVIIDTSNLINRVGGLIGIATVLVAIADFLKGDVMHCLLIVAIVLLVIGLVMLERSP